MKLFHLKSVLTVACALGFVGATADTSEAGLFDWCHHKKRDCCQPCPPPTCCPEPACYAPPACGCAAPYAAYHVAPSCGCAAPVYHGAGHVPYSSHHSFSGRRSPGAFYDSSFRGPRSYYYGY